MITIQLMRHIYTAFTRTLFSTSIIFYSSRLPRATEPRASCIWKSIRSSTVPYSTTKLDTSRNKSESWFIWLTIPSISCLLILARAGLVFDISSMSSCSYSRWSNCSLLSPLLSRSLISGRLTSPVTPYNLLIFWMWSFSICLRRLAASLSFTR